MNAPVLPSGTETILLVEDEEGLRRLARMLLEVEGYAVLEAASGAEALDLARRHSGAIHLLLTDVIMPGMGGRRLATAVAAVHPETRVLFMSGYTDDAVLRHRVREPGVGFLPKPFAPEALARKVREALDSLNEPAEPDPDAGPRPR